MVTIAEGIAAATFALKAAKDLREIDRSISDAEFKLKIADISTTLADVKLAMVEVQDQLREKEAKIEELSKSLKKKVDLFEKYGYQYEKVDGKPVGRPFCNVCLEDGRFIRIEQTHLTGGGYVCPKCKAHYPRSAPTYRNPDDAS